MRLKSVLMIGLRGLSGKYRACLYISTLVLFCFIGRVASFKVIPTWLNNSWKSPGAHFYGRPWVRSSHYFQPSFCHRIAVLWVVSWVLETAKSHKGYVGTLRRLSKQCNTVFTQKLLHKIRWMRWRVIVLEKPVTTHTRVIPNILFKISQTVVFGIPSHFLVREQLIDDHLQSQVAPAQYYPMFLPSKVGQNENHYQQKCGLLWNDYTTILFVFCSYTHSQRPSASSE